jgi:hypothetical protein
MFTLLFNILLWASCNYGYSDSQQSRAACMMHLFDYIEVDLVAIGHDPHEASHCLVILLPNESVDATANQQLQTQEWPIGDILAAQSCLGPAVEPRPRR